MDFVDVYYLIFFCYIWKGHTMSTQTKKRRSERSQINQRITTKIWQRNHKRVYFHSKIYNTWQQLKYEEPYRSDSDFAAYLITLEMKRRER